MKTLADHALYAVAKKRRDAEAAVRICDDLHDESTLDAIYDACHVGRDHEPPLVVAPAPTIGDTQNALATAYAAWLAKQMRWTVGSAIFQRKTSNRDFIKDHWFRLANEPEFYGDVEPGRRYVIADDVCTLGGTVASLRGFIESQGGRVICMTTLASRDGSHAQISLAGRTLRRVSSVNKGAFPTVFREEMGYELDCLTEHEGRFLADSHPTPDQFRARINGARRA